MYGPKAAGTWPGTGTSLVGPAGPAGSLAAILLYVGLAAGSINYTPEDSINNVGMIKTAGSVITF